jgi:hypothetical protein
LSFQQCPWLYRRPCRPPEVSYEAIREKGNMQMAPNSKLS